MEIIPWLIGAFIIGNGIYMLMQHNAVAQGRELNQKFVDLGTIAGKTKEEIISAVGPPSSFSALPEGKILLQWIVPGCHIALSFDGETCEGVTHQFTQ